MGLEKYFKTLENMIDINAQTKWLVIEKFTHFELNLDMFQNMARMLKKKNKMKAKVWIPRLANFQNFWSLFNREGCEISKNKHHDCAMNDNGVIYFERIKEGGGAINGYEPKLNLLNAIAINVWIMWSNHWHVI